MLEGLLVYCIALFFLLLCVDLELPVLQIEENWHCGVNSCVKSIHVMYAYMCKGKRSS